MSESKITQKALAVAMKELMAQLPFKKISVLDICDKCGISRKSFYYHFKDKYDLVNWIFYTEYLSLVQDKEYINGWQCLYDICDYLYKNKDFYIKALSISGQNSFQEYFCEIIQPYLIDFLEEATVYKNNGNIYIEFLTDITLMSILRWLQNTQDISPQQFLAFEKEAVLGICKLIEKEEADTPCL